MKLFSVAIVAVALVSGCGVGADETLEGPVGVEAQGLEQGSAAVGLNTGAQVPVGTTTSAFRDPSLGALPQDPIPVREGRGASVVDSTNVVKRVW